jgi:penicillin G amidase
MFKRHPLISRAMVFLVVPLLIAALCGYLHLRRSLPDVAGISVKARVLQQVAIGRDEHGVVYIDAKTDHDAFFALGYAHAQDRLWQLELERRIAQGRLSEVLGKNALDQDVWMRTLGLYASAEQSWNKLSPDAQASLVAYADGINAWIKQNPVLPPEFIALGVKPEPWRPLDSLAWSKVFALNLAGNMWNEISNLSASHYLSKEQAIDLLGYDVGGSGPSAQVKTQHLADFLMLKSTLESRLKLGGRFVGSNAWVVAGKYMKNGKAALANDPHLGLQIPSLWYAAHLKGDKLDVQGMTLVGLPVVVFGENRNIAWGGTSMMADVQDLYVEQTDPQKPNTYLHHGTWIPFKTRVETIAVKADFPSFLRPPPDPVRIQVRETEDGPVVSDAIGAFEQPVALKWTALDADDASYESFFRVDYAENWGQFKEAFRGYVAPAMNILYADNANNIGSIGIGRIPIRASGQARLPVPGWNSDYAWTGYIPFDAMPQRFNPPSGYIVSANNKPVDDNYPYFISNDWAPPARAQRIDQLIQAKISKGEGMTLDDFEHMQADTMDLSAQRLLAYLKTVPLKDGKQRETVKELASWSGDMSRDSQGAAVFFIWSRHLREDLFTARLKKLWNKPWEFRQLEALVANTTYDQIYDALTHPRESWCGENDTDTGADACVRKLSDSLNETIAELSKLRGSNPKHWRWGDVHYTLYSHTPFSKVSSVAPWFERKISSGGAPNTIDVGSAAYKEGDGYEQTFGAGFRQIMQSESDGTMRNMFMNSTGQSGNVLSRHYDDMVEPFRDAAYFEMDGKQLSDGSNRLTLIPE